MTNWHAASCMLIAFAAGQVSERAWRNGNLWERWQAYFIHWMLLSIAYVGALILLSR